MFTFTLMQSNQQIPHANRSYTLSGEPALFADRGFTGTRSVSSGFGGFCKAKTDERTNPAVCSESGKWL